MKKILIVLIAAVLVPATAFAGAFGLSLGLNTGLDPNLGTIIEAVETESPEIFKNAESYQFGPELRVRLLCFELDVNALFKSNGVEDGEFYEKFNYQIYANAGLSFSLFNIVRLGVGVGTDMLFSPRPAVPEMKMVIGAGTIDDPGRLALMKEMNLENMALTAPLNLRANVDFNIGPVAIGFEGLLPTNLCAAMLSDMDAWQGAFEGAFADWKRTKISIYAGFNFF